VKKQGNPASNEGGQAILEYILLLSIILVGLGLFLQKISSSFDVMTARRGGALEKQIRTGSAPASLWTK
jgi:hypothetical protein